jgi:phage host-nuclease inhibitor protein Gam
MKKIEKNECILEAEKLLKELKSLNEVVEDLKKEADEALKEVKQKYSYEMQIVKNAVAVTEKKLIDLLKGNRRVFFSDGDYKNLENGSVWVRIKRAVKKARGVTVELLEKLEYLDGIKIEKSVDWNMIEKWPDEKLAAIGTERIEKEDFGYDF